MTARSCDGCTKCCTIMAIAELSKPRNQHCFNCGVGKGCKIYDDRPQSCRDFFCLYLTDLNVGEHWKPSHSRMVLTRYSRERLTVHVSADRADAWRREPYYLDLKRWSELMLPNGIVTVYVRNNLTVVLPGRDRVIGEVDVTQRVRIFNRGAGYDAELVAA